MSTFIVQNLDEIRERMRLACLRAERDPEAVRLLAVSKTYGPEAVRAAAEWGQTLFGENRVQEAVAKIPECPAHLQWHLIGHLQSNKAVLAARWFDWVHSVDSIKLLELLDRHAGEEGRFLHVLVQVNVSGERSKSGLAPEQVADVLVRGNDLHHVAIQGVMTLPPALPEAEQARPFFRRLREWRDEWQTSLQIGLPELSMGMTHDMEVAIEEGATIVRVGTGVFGARAHPVEEEGE